MRIKLILIIAFTLIAIKSKAQNETVNGDLSVNGIFNLTSNNDAIMTFNNTDDAWQYFQFKHSGVRKAWLGFDPSNNFRITKEQGGNILFMGSNIGINTTNPGAKLDVNGIFRISNLGTDKKIQFLRTGGDVFSIEHDANRLYFYNSTTSKSLLSMNNGGNVGVGTVNPYSKLHVHEDGGTEMRLSGNSPSAYGELIFSSNNSGYKDYGASISGDGGGTGLNVGQLIFKTGYGVTRTERLRITSNGSVGIGTTTPSAKLHVNNGDIRLSNARGVQFSDQYWEIGRNIVTTNGSTSLSSNKMQFVSYGNANEGYQFTDRLGNALFEIESSSGDAVFNKGKVGIGTTAPGSKLQVSGTPSDRVLISNSTVNYNTNSPKLSLFGYSTGSQITGPSLQKISTAGYGQGRLAIFQHGGADYTSEEEVMSILPSGNVGIGTTTPLQLLSLNRSINTVYSISNPSEFGDASDMMTLYNTGTDSGSLYTSLYFRNNGSSGNAAGRLVLVNETSGSGSFAFHLRDNSHTGETQEKMRLDSDGNLGIGTSNPLSNLHIEGTAPIVTFKATNLGSGVRFNSIGQNGDLYRFQKDGNTEVIIKNSGSVGIGTTTTGSHKLAVEGSIGAREIKVEATGWSDFVFYNDYKLPTLKEVENHIKEKGHLKDIPSEKEVMNKGINLGEMNAKLLQKIEELTLYTIQQEKKIQKQEQEIKALKDVSNRLSKIEKMLAKKN